MSTWLKWMVASALAVGASMVVGVVAGRAVQGSGPGAVVGIAMAVGIGSGLLIGLAQWYAARTVMVRAPAWLWALASLVLGIPAWAATLAVASFPPDETLPEVAILTLGGGFLGLGVGAVSAGVQARLIDATRVSLGSWVLSGAAAWGAGMLVMGYLASLMIATADVATAELIGAVAGLAGGAIAGAISGFPFAGARRLPG